MTFEVEFTVLQEDEHVSVGTAWVSAKNVTECKEIVAELAQEINSPQEKICSHIGELNC